MAITVPARRRAFHVMAKPIGPVCNLRCSYCFYLGKDALYPGRRDFRMSAEVLESFVRQYIAAQQVPEVNFAWQGGEPTLLGLEFFRSAVALQKRFLPPGMRLSNALQTNGTLLDDAWCEFLRENDFLVGLSLDGPSEVHDTYRRDRRDRPTFDAVLRGLRLLREHRVEFNVLCVVHRANCSRPREIYQFLKGEGVRHIQFIPLVKRVPGGVTEATVPQGEYGRFLRAVYDEWVRQDVGRIYVQIFEAVFATWLGHGSGLCVFDPTCGKGLALEHNGDLYACDHYVQPEYRLGNILEQPLLELVESAAQRAFGAAKAAALPRVCRECDVRFVCNGECPRNRFLATPDGEEGWNYLCEDLRLFFHHVAPTMEWMAQAAARGRAPAEVMSALRAARPKASGSGKRRQQGGARGS